MTAASQSGEPLVDGFGRLHDNLRISVTDRCNIRCFYCMPEEPAGFAPRSGILSFEEIESFVRVAARLGVRKLRLTGGEPLLRKDLPVLVAKLAAISGIDEIALTTNGVLLAAHAQSLRGAGLHRLNVHLDTLDAARFQQITRRNELARVLEGIDAAQAAGLPLKINAVAIRGLVEPDILPLARFGRERGIEIRYIEFMPLDSQGLWLRDKVLSADDILRIIEEGIGPLEEIPDRDPRAPATEYRYRDGKGRIGFIASVSRPFCLNCNRLRLTADGKLRYCLFAIEELDVKPALRAEATPEERDRLVEEAIRANLRAKWIGHQINAVQFVPPPRPMYAIGG
jgi:cyclic pyranopterin phosphate synthase